MLDCIHDLQLFVRIIMSAFDDWVMDYYEKIWEEQGEEQQEPTEDEV